MTFLPTILAIGVGATIGASMRYYLTQFMNTTFGPAPAAANDNNTFNKILTLAWP